MQAAPVKKPHRRRPAPGPNAGGGAAQTFAAGALAAICVLSSNPSARGRTSYNSAGLRGRRLAAISLEIIGEGR